MGKLTFILGGARSGKSGMAVKIARDCKGKIAFIATCQALDKEMEKRIVLHQNSRPKNWQTFEASCDPELLVKNLVDKFDLIIVDCLTLLVTNLLLKGLSEKQIERKVSLMVRELLKNKNNSVIVSNEVGLGIVPENKLARDFRDIAGRMNQLVAQQSEEVLVMFAGLSLKLK